MCRVSLPPYLAATGIVLAAVACQVAEPGQTPAAGSLEHLTEHLDEAVVDSAGPPATAREERRWRFDEPHPE